MEPTGTYSSAVSSIFFLFLVALYEMCGWRILCGTGRDCLSASVSLVCTSDRVLPYHSCPFSQLPELFDERLLFFHASLFISGDLVAY